MDERIESRWSFASKSPFPWCAHLVEKLAPLALPVLRGPTLIAYSDYGGDAKTSRFETISFLFVNLHASGFWDRLRRATRKSFLPDGREMSFKSLNDGYRRNALIPFLNAADNIEGVCLVIAIDKRLASICTRDDMASEMFDLGYLNARWKPRSLERMFRIVHFVSLFTARLLEPGQNMYWISDRDELFANEARTRDTKSVLEKFFSLFVSRPVGELGLGTTDIDEVDFFDRDCAAIPDLVAGASAEMLSSLAQNEGCIPLPGTPVSPRVSRKADLISNWFFSQSGHLRKLALLFTSCSGSAGNGEGVPPLR